MESKHIKNDRDIKTGTIDEKETVCNRSASNSVFGKSIVVLKKERIQKMEDENIHAFVLRFRSLTLPELCAKMKMRYWRQM